MKRIRVEKELDNGWTRWVQPVRRNYIMTCCDCGLTHRLNFRIHNGRVQFQAQRAPAYTKRARQEYRKYAIRDRSYPGEIKDWATRVLAARGSHG